jgi:hypothetical protein
MKDETGKHRGYVSYLLRMWLDGGDAVTCPGTESAWRASLQSPETGELVGFGDIENLLAYLRTQTGHTSTGNEERKERQDNGKQDHR